MVSSVSCEISSARLASSLRSFFGQMSFSFFRIGSDEEDWKTGVAQNVYDSSAAASSHSAASDANFAEATRTLDEVATFGIRGKPRHDVRAFAFSEDGPAALR